MSEPMFSVVIPTHNGEAYLAAALESVLKQTYPYFEIVLLEHESTDHTLEIARSYNDPRIRICSTDQPQTIESNWARILDLELAEYLTILGHDDILYPEFLQEIVGLIVQEPDASLYFTHFHIIDSDGAIIRVCKPSPFKESGESFLRARQLFQRDSFGTGYVMRSADYKRIGGFQPFPRLIFADDFAFYSLADLSAKVCSPKFLFGYRYHRKTESYMTGLETLTEAGAQFIAALEGSRYAENPANMTLARDYFYQVFTRRYIRILVNLMQSGDTAKRSDYRKIREDFSRRFPQHSFSIYDVEARIVEGLTRLPLSGPQRLISRALQYIVRVTRGIKN
jgi:glycosyltransferase involved in cell wall biosynthesis